MDKAPRDGFRGNSRVYRPEKRQFGFCLAANKLLNSQDARQLWEWRRPPRASPTGVAISFFMYISKCCNSEVVVNMSPDFLGDDPRKQRVGTCWFECVRCKKACDVELPQDFTAEMPLD